MAPWRAFWLGPRRPAAGRRFRPFVEALEPRLQPVVALTPNQAFVNQLYQDLLHRDAEPGGLLNWTGSLVAGATRAQVAAGIDASSEFRTDALDALYQQFLGRGVDPSGLSSFLPALAAGTPLLQLEPLIAASPEFFAVSGSTNDGFLRALYRDVLGPGRPDPVKDAVGLQGWNDVLNSGVSRLEVASLIINGPESFGLQVDSLYVRFLRRSSDAGGLAAWTALAQQTGGLENVSVGILASDEYFQFAQQNQQPKPLPPPGTTATSTVITSFANLPGPTLGQVTLTAQVTSTPAGSTPTGTVQFIDKSTTTTPTMTARLDPNGMAQATVTLMATAHVFVATYVPDNPSFNTSTSPEFTLMFADNDPDHQGTVTPADDSDDVFAH